MVNESSIEYATALFEVALESKNVHNYFHQIIMVNELLEQEEDYLRLLEHPKIEKAKKTEMIGNVFKEAIQKEILHFLYILVDHNRIRNLNEIVIELTKLVNDYHKVLDVDAYTTVELDKKQRQTLTSKLEQKYKRKIMIENHIDSSIIGGMRLVIGEQIIDNSLRTHFAKLRSVLK
ncbi:F0F1 ATP synthase subunit delta [Haloplasma contractile]|uniref:ATP synthase subunit delta n=1 Tax=Haloplasma contractile SSD-17B TaxID=1033810 RepID=U2E9C9_9MOLU|nr:F0F1 ATP synthase subunit delta [Haloplasma contractile]ERJ11461.1 ATP synthase subunit delta protein [Haloplasma contractile SSD-17B]